MKKKINYKKSYGFLMTASFVAYIAVIFILYIIMKDKVFSENENRNLKTLPSISINTLMDGAFMEEFESYASDQFPERSFFVRVKSKVDTLIGKVEKQGVFIGKDNQLLQDFEERTAEETQAKVEAINSFAQNLEGVNIAFMLVPTATKILEEELPKDAPVDDEEQYIEEVRAGLSEKVKFINPTETLKSNKEEYLYYRTDHHWTTKGAYEGYRDLCRALELEPKTEDSYQVEAVTHNFYGSLSSRIGSDDFKGDTINIYFPKENPELVVNYVNAQEKTTTLYDSEKLNKKDKYEVFTGGNHPHINVKTLGDTSKKLLLIKDSYANSMLPFLTSHYGEIDVIDLRYYMDDVRNLIESQGITDILLLYNANTFNEDDSILNLLVE